MDWLQRWIRPTVQLAGRVREINSYLCPSPILVDNKLIVASAKRILAIRPGGSVDVTATHLEWQNNVGDEVCTPVCHNGYLYTFASNGGGVMTSVSLSDGSVAHRSRVEPKPGRVYASRIVVDDRIYLVSQENGVYVIAAKPEYELLARNEIEDDDSTFNGTPAVAGNRMYIRSNKRLYCIGR